MELVVSVIGALLDPIVWLCAAVSVLLVRRRWWQSLTACLVFVAAYWLVVVLMNLSAGINFGSMLGLLIFGMALGAPLAWAILFGLRALVASAPVKGQKQDEGSV
jgi:hypothetical protein